MGDASGEGADALHSLSAEKLRLNFAFLTDVGIDDEDRFRLSALIGHQRPLTLDDHWFVALSDLAGFAFPFSFLHDLLPGAIKIGPIPKQEFIGLFAAGFFGGPAVKAFGALVPIG